MAERSKAPDLTIRGSLWRLQVRFPYGDTLDGATSIFLLSKDSEISKSGALACLVIALLRGLIERLRLFLAYTMSENCYFLHTMSEK